MRASQVSPLRSRIEQLIQSIRTSLSVGSIQNIMAALTQLRSLNPTISNQLMGKLLAAIQEHVDAVMANATVTQAKQCLDCLGRCAQAMPGLATRIQDIQQRLACWINIQEQPLMPGKLYQSAAVHYSVMHETNRVQPTIPSQGLDAPVPIKPVMVGGIFIEPYGGLVPE